MTIRDIWRRITSGNSNESLEKTSVLRAEIKLGDFVAHSISGRKGTVVAVENWAGHSTVTFKDKTGRIIRAVSRQEVRLANAERFRP